MKARNQKQKLRVFEISFGKVFELQNSLESSMHFNFNAADERHRFNSGLLIAMYRSTLFACERVRFKSRMGLKLKFLHVSF